MFDRKADLGRSLPWREWLAAAGWSLGFLVLATLGLVQWIRSYRKQQRGPAAIAPAFEAVAG